MLMARGHESFTARAVATVRARVPRLSTADGDEAAADRFVDGVKLPLMLHWHPTLRDYLAARTAFFDRCLVEAIGRGARQVVIIGAGSDDRAIRMRSAGVRFIEVDEPTTQDLKRSRLAALGLDDVATFVPIDLALESLTDALGRHLDGAPAFVMAEAVFPYVPHDQVCASLRDLAAMTSAPSWLALDLPTEPETWRGKAALAGVKLGAGGAGERVQPVLSEPDARQTVSDSGWVIRSASDIADLGVAHLRGASLHIEAERAA
jgi:methyltransferase (TIGR00027 family)